MESTTRKRVAVFLARWEMMAVVSGTIKLLSDQGYEVDFFLYHNLLFVEMATLERLPGVQIYDLTTFVTGRRSRFKQRAEKLLRSSPPFLEVHLSRARLAFWEIRQAFWHLCGSEKGVLVATLVDQALKLMAGKQYQCLIGIEKAGLVWAGQVAERTRVPFLYYSLDVYNADYVRLGLLTSFSFKHLWWAERRYHRKAAGTIVQDLDRARVLLESNGVPLTDAAIACLPVSILGGPYTERSSFLRETLDIPEEHKIILCFGHIRERRYAFDFAHIAQEFPEGWVLVMHGFGNPATIDQIRRIDVKKKVVLSLPTVPSHRIQEVVASADIGLAMYSPLTQNERLTAFSSEKMALYMQCGVPFIAFDYPGYRRLATEDRCGLVVRDLSELPRAIATILASQEAFRQRAYRAFCKYYDLTANFANVRQIIERVGST